MDAAVLQAIESRKAVPSAPELVTRLVQITKDPEYRKEDVASLIASDAGLAGDVLRLANSALLGGGRKISSISDAIVRLGANQIRTIVLGRTMIDSFSKMRLPSFDMSYFWRRSLATAALAARFAETLVTVPRDAAFTSGLLCDVGVLVLAQSLPDKYRRVLEQYTPQRGDEMIVSEVELLGGSHADVGALVMTKWGLQDELIQAVRYHHHIDLPELSPRVVQLARILNGSGEIARFLCEVRSQTIVRSMCLWATETIGVRINVLQDVLRKVESDISELAGALRLDIVSSKVFELLAKELSHQLEEVSA